jgi:predicted nucleotidyltransferase
MIQLEQDNLDELRRIVRKNIDTEKWQPVIFGSRSNGTARKFSDIDLGFIGSEPLPISLKGGLNEALDESDLPYTVDVVDLHATSEEFRSVAGKSEIPLL